MSTGGLPLAPSSPQRRASLRTLAALAWLPAQPWLGGDAHAAIPNVHEAINRAGRQRMLSQRMAKAWLAVGQGVNALQAQGILRESIALFERQLDELKAFAPTPQVLGTYVALDPLWRDYKRTLLQGPPNRAQAADVLALDAKVLKLAHEGTMQLEAYAGKATGRLVNLSGRQRMLSQRAAKLYLSRAWGTANAQQVQELQQARREFADALTVLYAAPETTEAIRADIELVQQQWVFFDNALTKADAPSQGPLEPQGLVHAREVFASSENILQTMDRVTAQFSRLT